MSPYMRSIKLCPLSIFVVLVITTHAATEEAQQFFQHDHKAFLCNHSLQMNELKNVQWLINDVVCADIFIEGGVNTTTTWNCGLKTRAEMNISHLVISSLETRDEGEFRCMTKKGYFAAEEVTKFNVTINVRPDNHTLSLGDISSSALSCDTKVTVSTVEGNSTLICSVDSKPSAIITWSTVHEVSLQNVTVCENRSDNIYHCTSTLTLPNEDVFATSGLELTCHVQVLDDDSDRCIKLVPLLTTTETVDTTTMETISTASSSAAISSVATTTSEQPTTTSVQPTTTSEQPITTSEQPTTTSVQPTTTSEQPTTTNEQPTTTSEQPTTTSEQPRNTTTKVEITNANVPPTTSTAAFSVEVTIQKNFQKDHLNKKAQLWKDDAASFRSNMTEIFNDTLLSCIVNKFSKGSLVIDSTAKFDVNGLKSLADSTVNLEAIIENKIENSGTTFFQGAKVTAKQLSSKGYTPTTPSTTKWKNIYILPIVIGTVVIVVVAIIVLLRNCHNTRSSGDGIRDRGRVFHGTSHGKHMVAPGVYASISESPPTVPQQHNKSRYHRNTRQGQVERNDRGASRNDRDANRNDRGANRNDRGANRNDRGANRSDRGANRNDRGANRNDRLANRRDDPVIWNNTRQGPVSKNRHGVPRRSEPASWNSDTAHGRLNVDPRVHHQFRQSHVGYPVMPHGNRAVFPHVAKAYSNGYMGRTYY